MVVEEVVVVVVVVLLLLLLLLLVLVLVLVLVVVMVVLIIMMVVVVFIGVILGVAFCDDGCNGRRDHLSLVAVDRDRRCRCRRSQRNVQRHISPVWVAAFLVDIRWTSHQPAYNNDAIGQKLDRFVRCADVLSCPNQIGAGVASSPTCSRKAATG